MIRRPHILECDHPGCRAVRHSSRAVDDDGPEVQQRDLLETATQFGWVTEVIAATDRRPARTLHYCAMHRGSCE